MNKRDSSNLSGRQQPIQPWGGARERRGPVGPVARKPEQFGVASVRSGLHGQK